jgi:hypothetical protein
MLGSSAMSTKACNSGSLSEREGTASSERSRVDPGAAHFVDRHGPAPVLVSRSLTLDRQAGAHDVPGEPVVPVVEQVKVEGSVADRMSRGGRWNA